MFRLWFMEMKRASGMRFPLSVLLVAFLYIIGGMDRLSQACISHTMSLMGDVLGDAQLAPWMELLPVLALLPYGASLCEDRAQKYHQAIILRSGYRKYIAVKAIVACIVSGCVLALGETLFLMILLLLRSALPAAPESYFSCEPYLKAWADGGRWLPFFAFFVWLQFLYGMIWGAEAVFVSVWTRDRALVYASPLLTSSLLNVIYNLFGWAGVYGVSIGITRQRGSAVLPILAQLTGQLLLPTLTLLLAYFLLMQRRLERHA